MIFELKLGTMCYPKLLVGLPLAYVFVSKMLPMLTVDDPNVNYRLIE